MVKLGVIGYGYWGPNLVRNFFELPNCQIETVADVDIQSLNKLKKYYPAIQATTKPEDILDNQEIDAVLIATPVSTHFVLAKKALQAGKHVLVEKPMTNSLKDASELVKLAKKTKKILMVDHTFLYTDAVQKIKKMIDAGKIGKITYFDSLRTNLGIFQQDVNVLWDLMAHDISIINYLTSERPISVTASGVSHTKNGIENIAFVVLKYKSGLVAHFNSSWSSPVKIRLILIGGTKKMIVYDDIEPTEKVKLYDSNYRVKFLKDNKKLIVDYRTGDIYIPKIELKEGLRNMAEDFINAIIKKKEPISNANFGLEVVRILSLAEASIKQK